MPILASTGRRSLKRRIFIGGIYIALLSGAISMIYPLLLMICGSTKSGVDQNETTLVPRFLVSDRALYRKYIEGLFNEDAEMLRSDYDIGELTFDQLSPPSSVNGKLVKEWEDFVCERESPYYFYTIGFIGTPVSQGTEPIMLRSFKTMLGRQYGSSADQINAALNTQFIDWSMIYVIPEDFRLRLNSPGDGPFDRVYRAFAESVPVLDRCYVSVEGFYKRDYLKSLYTSDITTYNQVHNTNYLTYDNVRLPRMAPGAPKDRTDWERFVRTIVNLLWLRCDASALRPYHEFLRAKYDNIDVLNKRYSASYGDFSDIPLIEEPPPASARLSDWDAFVQGWKDPTSANLHIMPLDAIHIYSVEFAFRDALQEKYKNIGSLNEALDTRYIDFGQIQPPQAQWHYVDFRKRMSAVRLEFVTRNFRSVCDYLLLHGRGVLNTAFYCLLSVISALIVNPLAAYALSRYRPRNSYNMLLFLMLTMAFPSMVTQIPVFLMLKNLGLLNTFWALILPGMANGYSIFLLKGFFDSLPLELYDSASLDGAGELRIFWQITMSLSRPILAVIALNAFTLAYSNFMFAVLVCQDQKMWTLMVWLYQLQSRSGPAIMYASLLLAAIPTFLVFAFCQNVIMRGIVVPVEK
jgi:multiple sugar transport system permease protein